MTCVGHYEIKPPIYDRFVEKKKCVRTNGILENGLMHFYNFLKFQCDKCLQKLYKLSIMT